MSNIAIVITAYNRSNALRNLLQSLEQIKCHKSTTLIISIDNRGTAEVNRIANDFEWKYGEKEVIIHDEKLGLRNHFIWAGDQTYRFENVIFLEDDLVVSPELMNFSNSAVEFYKDDETIAGICLYNPILCEFNGCKFYQNQDGYDIYFLQHPYWGNIWSKKKWNDFKEWLPTYKQNSNLIPRAVSSWRETSFKKVYIQYLAEKEKYIVVPRISLVTNNGEAGLHNSDGLYQYQTVLMNGNIDYRFCKLNNSKAVYDVHMELIPEILKLYNTDLVNYNFEVDLKGNKHLYTKDYVLTTRPTNNSILEFSSLMKPVENGVIYKANGEGIKLCRKNDVIIDKSYKSKILIDDIDMNYHIRLKTVIPITFNTFRKSILRRIKKLKGE